MINNNSSETSNEFGGELVLGGYNPDRFTGNLTWAPVIGTECFWEIIIQSQAPLLYYIKFCLGNY